MTATLEASRRPPYGSSCLTAGGEWLSWRGQAMWADFEAAHGPFTTIIEHRCEHCYQDRRRQLPWPPTEPDEGDVVRWTAMDGAARVLFVAVFAAGELVYQSGPRRGWRHTWAFAMRRMFHPENVIIGTRLVEWDF